MLTDEMRPLPPFSCFFFLNDPPPPEIYPLSLPDALPIWAGRGRRARGPAPAPGGGVHEGRRPGAGAGVGAADVGQAGGAVPVEPAGPGAGGHPGAEDRKSTRLNSSHLVISYAVFCLKKNR